MPKRKAAPKPRRLGGGVRYHAGRAKPWEAVPSIRVNGLKPKSQYFATEAEADAHLRELHARHTLGQLDVQLAVSLRTFIETAWLPAVERANYKPQSIMRYHSMWRLIQQSPLDLRRDFRTLTVTDMRVLEAWLVERYARSTIDNVMSLVGAVYKYAASRELTTKNPVATLRASRLDRPTLPEKARRHASWSPTQVRTFLAAIAGEPDEAFWLLVATRLLRQGEARALVWENWHRDTDAIHVAASLTYWNAERWERTSTKSAAGDRSVSVGSRLERALQARQAATPWCKPGDFVFSTPRGKPWRPDKPVDDLKMWCRRLKLPLITPHTFRHIGNTIWDGLGVPENVRHEASGHTAEQNRHYTHVVEGRIRTAFASLDDAFGMVS